MGIGFGSGWCFSLIVQMRSRNSIGLFYGNLINFESLQPFGMSIELYLKKNMNASRPSGFIRICQNIETHRVRRANRQQPGSLRVEHHI